MKIFKNNYIHIFDSHFKSTKLNNLNILFTEPKYYLKTNLPPNSVYQNSSFEKNKDCLSNKKKLNFKYLHLDTELKSPMQQKGKIEILRFKTDDDKITKKNDFRNKENILELIKLNNKNKNEENQNNGKVKENYDQFLPFLNGLIKSKK